MASGRSVWFVAFPAAWHQMAGDPLMTPSRARILLPGMLQIPAAALPDSPDIESS